MKIYITTWDYDGLENRSRPLGKEPGPFTFGGGGPGGPLIMDDTAVMEVK